MWNENVVLLLRFIRMRFLSKVRGAGFFSPLYTVTITPCEVLARYEMAVKGAELAVMTTCERASVV